MEENLRPIQNDLIDIRILMQPNTRIKVHSWVSKFSNRILSMPSPYDALSMFVQFYFLLPGYKWPHCMCDTFRLAAVISPITGDQLKARMINRGQSSIIKVRHPNPTQPKGYHNPLASILLSNPTLITLLWRLQLSERVSVVYPAPSHAENMAWMWFWLRRQRRCCQ